MKHLKLFFTNDDCLISSEREGGNSGSANLQVEKLCVCVYVSEHNQVLSSSIIYINFFISFCLFLLSVIFSLGVLFVCLFVLADAACQRLLLYTEGWDTNVESTSVSLWMAKVGGC